MRRGVCDGVRRSAAVLSLALAAAIAVPAPAHAAGLTVVSQALTPVRTCVVTATPTTTTNVRDAAVRQSSPTTNAGSATTTTVQSGSSANARLYLLFLLTGCSPAIPTGATVRLATLRLYLTAVPTVCRTLDVFPVTAAWSESTVTWNNQPFGTTLNNPPTASRSASFSVGNVTGCQNRATGYVSGAVVTTDAQSYVGGTTSNLGWMIRDDTESAATTATETFAAKELGTLPEAPQLVVSYVVA